MKLSHEQIVAKSKERIPADTLVNDCEYFATEDRFDDLLGMAVETCLSEPLPQIDRVEPTNEQRIVSTGGLHALRIALEMELGQELWPNYIYEDEEALPEGKFWVQMDSPLRMYIDTHDPIDFTIAKKVEQFGKALIDEAFATLGADAPEQVEKMRTGDHAQQMEVINWLSDRINAMKEVLPNPEGSDEYDNEDENGVFFYHPIRLSPKAVGVYPDMKMLPTCLGASILVSSFLEKAGMTYMHGGVAMTAFGQRLQDSMMLFSNVREIMSNESGNTWPSPLVEEKMQASTIDVWSRLVEDLGYHAAVMVRLNDGHWVMIDPYFKVVDEVVEQTNDDYEKIYQTLDEFRENAPGLELSCQSGLLNIEAGLSQIVSSGLSISQEPESIGKMLVTLLADPENGRDQVYDDYILPHFKRIAEQTDYRNAANVTNDLLEYSGGKHDKVPDLLREAFDQVIDKYVLWGEDVEKIKDRVTRDKEYYINRIVDVSHIPTMMCVVMAARNLNEGILGTYSHERMEFGLPHTRIGYSVLSDFASYTDDELPPSFWFAHWGSLVPITETLPRGGATQYQRDLQEFMAKWSRTKYLTYIKSYPIIVEFLQALSSEEEDQNGKSL